MSEISWRRLTRILRAIFAEVVSSPDQSEVKDTSAFKERVTRILAELDENSQFHALSEPEKSCLDFLRRIPTSDDLREVSRARVKELAAALRRRDQTIQDSEEEKDALREANTKSLFYTKVSMAVTVVFGLVSLAPLLPVVIGWFA